MKKIISILILSVVVSTAAFSQGISIPQQRKLIQALTAISNMYVDTINDTKIVENTIRSVLEELDPHSTYTPKEEVQRMHEPLEGSFDGIGVQFQIIKDTINVVQTVSGTPAEKVGVLPGDKIVFINDSLVAGVKIQNSDVLKKLRGKRGTPVWVKIKRGTKDDFMEFKIVRDKIPLYSVDASYMLTDKIGYIKVNNFGNNTTDEFNKALKKLKNKGMEDLVLSLERNGGGFLKTSIELADEFLPSDKLIVYTDGLHVPRTEAKSTNNGNFKTGRLVILVDEYSASASEILSGAVQDWDRGVIVGRRSFGKGLVQRELPLNDGSMMRLTVARYFTPTGRSIQKPYNKGVKEYNKDLIERYNSGELLNLDSVHFPDSLQYKTLIRNRTVYGGGGIMPDIFVPIDTTNNTSYHRELIAKGILNSTVIEYMNENRDKLKKQFTDFEKFNNEFEVSEAMLKQLIEAGEKEDVKFIEDEYNRSKRMIKLQMKAIIANNLWEVNEFYQVIGLENESLRKAVEILTTKGMYEKILTESR
ncbi:MAG: S41 family peptidase [Porphyromonadaceae bacterium]|nr:S41 family peptidase [Porphyromonadaceae bacterium]